MCYRRLEDESVCPSPRKAIRVLGMGLGILMLSLPLFPQGNAGRILGAITDQSGGVIVGSTVTIIDTQRGTTRIVRTDESGLYAAPNLLPSTYSVRAEAKGFKTIERPNLLLEVSQEIRVDLALQPGDQTQTVVVTSEAPMLETTNATLGGALSNQTINDLPLNGRNFTNLLTLRPGVTIYPGGGALTQSTDGIRAHDNVYLVDGVNNTDPYWGESIMNGSLAGGDASTILPIDAIDEFKTETNPPAEYGWKPGAIVNIGIKSGTNTLHGTAYAYGRDGTWDARNYFNVAPAPRTPLDLEQFGATIGGPVKKDKLFYFLSYEDQRYSVGNPTQHTLPITAATGGDATTNLQLGCQAALAPGGGGVAALSAQLAGLEPSTCAPLSNYPGLFPVNNGPSLVTKTLLGNHNQIDSGLVKVDYHVNEHHSLNGMYFISEGGGLLFDSPPIEVAPEWALSQYQRSQTGSASWTWTPNSTWVNEARVGYAHDYLFFVSEDHNDNPANYSFRGNTYHLYTGQKNPVYFGLPQIAIQGFNFQFGNQFPKIVGPDGVLQLLDHVSYLRGKHAFKFGGEILSNQSTNDPTGIVKGPVRFGNLMSFFNGVPNFAALAAGNLSRHFSDWGYAAFLQDDWRVAPSLTLNFGIRYEITTVFKESHNQLGNFDPNRGLLQVGKQIQSPFNGDHNNFAPRLGLAWDVRGNGKTVIRAGGGVIYEQLTFDVFNEVGEIGLRDVPTGVQLYVGGAQQPSPGNIAVSIISYSGSELQGTTTPGQVAYDWIHNGPTVPLYQAAPSCGDGNPVAGVIPTPQPCSVLGITRGFRTPYVTNWTLDLQHAITDKLSLEVGYVGNHGTKLSGITDINQPPFVNGISPGWGSPTTVGSPAYNCLQSAPAYGNCISPGNLALVSAAETASRPFNNKFPYLQYIDVLSNLDTSNYNALQAILTQRPSHGLSLTAGYTYGHSLDDASDSFGNVFHIPVNNANPRSLYGSGDYDIRHRFTLTTTYALPGKKSPAQILEGWSLNSIVTVQSGLPWGVNDATNDFSGSGEVGQIVASTPGQGEQWDLVGNPSDFTTIHGLTNTNGGIGGVPFFNGSAVPAACTRASTALGPLAVASLTNSGCFALGNSVMVPPPYGSYGMTGRNIFRDAGFRDWDFSVSKDWKFKERLTAQLRAEFFNVLNHPSFANPYGGAGGGAVSHDPSLGAGFGCGCVTPDVGGANPVLGVGGSRAIQLGLKLIF
jgi:hypothetical protein